MSLLRPQSRARECCTVGVFRAGWLCPLAVYLICAGPASAQQILSEVRLGVLAHDVPVLGTQKEHGADINGELLFVSPISDDLVAGVTPALRWILVPRPNIGGDVNTAGDTSQLYLGVTWTATLFEDLTRQGDSVFLGIGLGPAFNNGYDLAPDDSRKSLGSHVLFHYSLDLGYRFDSRYSASVYIEHSSNAGLARENQGLTNAGLRVGLAF